MALGKALLSGPHFLVYSRELTGQYLHLHGCSQNGPHHQDSDWGDPLY